MLHTITTVPNDTTSKKLDSLIQTILSAKTTSSQTDMHEERSVLTQEGAVDSHLTERIHVIQEALLCHK